MILKKKISVIIRTKNEERWIGHCIQSVLEMMYKPEIIIVDNKSEDKTISIVKSFRENLFLKNSKSDKYTKIKILNINDYSPGKSLNLGVKSASNPIILIISAHCVLRKINLAKHIKDLKKYRCIFGNQVPVWNGKKLLNDIFGVISKISKSKICIQNKSKDILCITPFLSLKEVLF